MEYMRQTFKRKLCSQKEVLTQQRLKLKNAYVQGFAVYSVKVRQKEVLTQQRLKLYCDPNFVYSNAHGGCQSERSSNTTKIETQVHGSADLSQPFVRKKF